MQRVISRKTLFPGGRGDGRAGGSCRPDPGLAVFSHQKPRRGDSCRAAAGSGMQSSSDETHPVPRPCTPGASGTRLPPEHHGPIAPTQPGAGSGAGWLSPSPRCFPTQCAPRGDKIPSTLSPNTPASHFWHFFAAIPPQHPDFCSLKCPHGSGPGLRRGALRSPFLFLFQAAEDKAVSAAVSRHGAARRLRPRGGEAPCTPQNPRGPGCGQGTRRSCSVCRCGSWRWDRPSDSRAAL